MIGIRGCSPEGHRNRKPENPFVFVGQTALVSALTAQPGEPTVSARSARQGVK